MDFFTNLGLTTVSTGTVFAFFVWLFKKNLLAIIDREVKKEIEDHKHELQKEQELLKYDLRRNFIKEEFYSSSIQNIYPEILKLLLEAHGHLSSFMGLEFRPTFEDYGESDFEKLLIERNLTDKKRTELLSKIKNNRKEGVREMQALLREIDIQNSGKKIRETKNFFLLKKIFMSSNVVSSVRGIVYVLNSSWVDFSMLESYGDGSAAKFRELRSNLDSVFGEIEALEETMRSELVGGNI